jgi:superfamily II DNA/RNA helicase
MPAGQRPSHTINRRPQRRRQESQRPEQGRQGQGGRDQRRDDPSSALEAGLNAAAAAPAPPPASFAELGLHPRLVAALAAGGIQEPFAIQSRAVPDALTGQDILGRAQTGSGKTLAFGLPLLNRLASSTPPRQQKTPRALVLVPTRELAQQVADVLSPLGRAVGVSIATVYGGVSIGRQIDQVRHADIVVATPGRLGDLIERRAVTLAQVEITVLDEADHMADLGFLPVVTRLLDQTPTDGQRMFFSATLDRGVGKLVTRYVTNPALHAVPETVESTPAEHTILVLRAEDKLPVSAEIAARPGRTLFFVRTKHGADRLVKQLSRVGVGAAAIHGNRSQGQRQRALGDFAAGHPRVLVATDVAARGIHVDDVDLVVHFDPPEDHKDYLHRSGRTARAGASGQVLALAERGQVRDLQRMHVTAGITASTRDAAPGHDALREFAVSGTPVPPAPHRAQRPVAETSSRRQGGPSRQGGSSREGSPSREGAPSRVAGSPARSSRSRRQPRRPARQG